MSKELLSYINEVMTKIKKYKIEDLINSNVVIYAPTAEHMNAIGNMALEYDKYYIWFNKYRIRFIYEKEHNKDNIYIQLLNDEYQKELYARYMNKEDIKLSKLEIIGIEQIEF